ncbi:hypothetical protein G4B88_011080 [Cannabis sativa]|uniref:Reverse transcriptase zinc-binding domain-containing protein n=1 Tax=Cannabis sativa TaxID=3483 RepID=A0A7J6FD13_CANSA|nr:hypothetical protein G4B88_011080 [Cannabis sativa]
MRTVRFRATVDVDKTLFSGFFMKRDSIKDLWIQYKYEKLPKFYLKCGIMSHEQKYCFKPPTVTKDAKGNFFPLFGSWMKHEEAARWPLSPDLPKWFQQWIIQKRLTLDPKFKDQWKMANSLQIADSWEARESRRQLPGKRRMVEQLVEEMPETEEVRVCRFPMVTLPGVGDVCSFEDSANLVVPKGPDVMPPLDVSTNKNESDNTQSKLALTKDAQSGETVQTTVLVNPSCIRTSGVDSSKSIVQDNLEMEGDLSKDSNELGRPQSLKGQRYYSSMFGTQAQVIPWPSNELWSLGFKTLSGLGTVDKFLREPSIFNPILGIEDFRSVDQDFGPKKRKALEEPPPLSTEDCKFSPGTKGETTPRRKRGRPVSKDQGKAIFVSEFQEQKPVLKRGRPPKEAQNHGPKTFSLKRQARNTVTKRQQSIRANWEKNAFDLKVDLSNHFIVADYISKPSSSCVKFSALMMKIHYSGVFYVPPVASAGGLALCWKQGVDCIIQRGDKFQIQACISSDPPGKPWILMGVYGPPTYADKEGFWNEIADFVCMCKLPVMLIGDLNGTLLDSDCLNYSRASNIGRYSFDFRRAVQRSGLIDLGYNGVKFTWCRRGSNSTSSPSLKRARLDRALASVDWRLAWPNAIVSHLTATSSDHNPIILDTCGGRHCSKPQFKYELMWERDPRVFWVVKNAWMTQTHRNPMVNMYRKIKATKEHLQKWNNVHFRKLATQISEARARLEDIESNQTWNVERIRCCFDSRDATDIMDIGLPASKQEDSWHWLEDKRGLFSVKSAYHLVTKHRCVDIPNWHSKLIWNCPVHARLKLLWWQIMNNSLPTRERLAMAFNIPCILCPLCDAEVESSFHVLWQCNFAKAIWFGSLWGIRTNLCQCGNWSEWKDWFNDRRNRPVALSFVEFITGALCIFESIWKVLNDVRQGGHHTQISVAIQAIRVRYRDHQSCILHPRSKTELNLTPPPGWLTCCTDVSIDTNLSVGAAVFRDDKNRICGVYSACFTATEPALVEALTLATAGQVAVQHQFQRVGFFCDNVEVVSNFSETNSHNIHLNLAGAAAKFKSTSLQLQSVQLSKIGR